VASDPGFGTRRRTGGTALARRVVAYALLLGESLVILIPSIYGRAAPKLSGIPFFYWFQLLWIVVGMVVTGIAYLLIGRDDEAPATTHDGARVP
jgi:hypothetical protein